MSGYSFLTIVLVDLLLVNQAHFFKLPIFSEKQASDESRFKFHFNPNLTSSEASSSPSHARVPSALVNLSYEGDNYCSGILISEEMVLTAVACLYSNQTLLDKYPSLGMHIDLTDKKNVVQQPCNVKGNYRESTACFWVHI